MSHALEASSVEVLLCDADGNLFPSEEPAFVASTEVTNRLLESVGSKRRFTPEELRVRAVGRNFRSTALELAAEDGLTVPDADLEHWVREEKAQVTSYLGRVLEPDAGVSEPLERLAQRYRLAAVSSSALSRLDPCFRATRLDALFPPESRYSAEDSLPVPTSKPDPAIYAHTLERLSLAPTAALAIEDALPGVLSAVAAGIPTVGNVVFVPEAEREERVEVLREAGATTVVGSWAELEGLLGG